MKKGLLLLLLLGRMAAAQTADSAGESLFADNYMELKYQAPDDDPLQFGDQLVLAPRGDYSFRYELPAGQTLRTGDRWPCVFVVGTDDRVTPPPGWMTVTIPDHRETGALLMNFIVAHDNLKAGGQLLPGMLFVMAPRPRARAAAWLAGFRPGIGGVILAGGYSAPGSTNETPLYFTQYATHNTNALTVCIAQTENAETESELTAFVAQLPATNRIHLITGRWAGAIPPSNLLAAALGWIDEQACFELPFDSGLRDYYERQFVIRSARLLQAPGTNCRADLEQLLRMADERELAGTVNGQHWLPKLQARLDQCNTEPEPPPP